MTDRNCLIYVSCYNVGLSPSIINFIRLISSRLDTTVLLLNAPNWNDSLFSGCRVRPLVLDQLLGSSDAVKGVMGLANSDTLHIAFEPHGFALAMLLFPDSTPYYYSLELYMSYDHFGLDYPDEIRLIERGNINRIKGFIIQSSEKERLFREDYGVGETIPAFILPVTGNGRGCGDKSEFLRKRFGIGKNKKIALSLGGIRDWYGSIELAIAFSELDDWALVFHGFSDNEYLDRLHETISRCGITNVYISLELFDNPEGLAPIIMSADAGLAWYADISIGFRSVAKSSGKIASYLRYGIPVITSSYPGTIEAIELTDCGLCISEICQTGDALNKICRDYSRYSAAALAEYEKTYNFDAYKDNLLSFLDISREGVSVPVVVEKEKRVLLAVTHFWPSVGGLETIAEQLGIGLLDSGYQVSVLALAIPARQADRYKGIEIITVDRDKSNNDILAYSEELKREIESGRYAACIAIQDPTGFSIWTLGGMERRNHTRLIVQPIINADAYSRWCDDSNFTAHLASALKNLDAVVTLTRSGIDRAFMSAHGIESVYIPNAVEVESASFDFRERYGISRSDFMLLHVANLYRVKNHVGLLKALEDIPQGWRLVMIGHPTGEPEYALELMEELKKHPEVLFIPGLPPKGVASAMAATDMVLLASFGEGSPVTILEAMAHGKPWLATPTCGAAVDNAGGIIAELDQFHGCLKKLFRHEEIRSYLGTLGRRHWKSCFTWEKVISGWVSLIEGNQQNVSFEMPSYISASMQLLRESLEE